MLLTLRVFPHLYSTSLRTNARVKVTAPSHLLLNHSYAGRERWQRRFACRKLSFRRCRNQSFPNRLLPSKLAGSTHSLRFFAGLFFRWLFVGTPSLHFSEDALALHFLFQNAKRLIDVVIADKYLQYRLLQSFDVSLCRNAAPFRICFGRTSHRSTRTDCLSTARKSPLNTRTKRAAPPFQYIRETAKPIELAQPQALARRECKSFFNPTMSLETGLYDRSARLTANRMQPSYTFISGMQGAFHRPGDISAVQLS
jgi:hypothetical protein